MADPSERIHALRIDREAHEPGRGGGRLWLLVPAVLIVFGLLWWFLWRAAAGAVEVRTDTARISPSFNGSRSRSISRKT